MGRSKCVRMPPRMVVVPTVTAAEERDVGGGAQERVDASQPQSIDQQD